MLGLYMFGVKIQLKLLFVKFDDVIFALLSMNAFPLSIFQCLGESIHR